MRRSLMFALFSVLVVPMSLHAADKIPSTPAVDGKASITTEEDDKNAVEESTIGSDDICLNETITFDPSAENPVDIQPGTSVPAETCHCVIGGTPTTPTYSGVGVVTVLNEEGVVTHKISKCDPRGSEITATLGGSESEADIAREETRELLEDAVLTTGSLPDMYERIFAEAGIDTRDIFEGRSREDAARLISDLAFGDSAAKAEAAAEVGIPADQLQRLSANAVRLTPTRPGVVVEVFNNNLSASERNRYLAGDTFTVFNPLTAGDPAAVLAQARCAISTIESGSCQGNYGAVGPATRTGNRAYGRYQVMDFNIPSWTREACGRAYTVNEFVNSPQCQDAVFDRQFGGYIERYGSPENAARVWFGGPGALNNPGADDGYTSVAEYAERFTQIFGEGVPFNGTATAYTGGNGSPFANSSPFQGVLDVIWPGNPYSEQDIDTLISEITGESPQGGNPSSGGLADSVVNFFSSLFGNGSGGGLGSGPVNGSTEGGGGGGSGSGSPSGSAAVTPEVATIIAQPAQALRGKPIIVSWSSLGMSSTEKCSVNMRFGNATSSLAIGNEGSKSIETTATTTVGVHDFILQCTAVNGDSIRRTTSVVVL